MPVTRSQTLSSQRTTRGPIPATKPAAKSAGAGAKATRKPSRSKKTQKVSADATNLNSSSDPIPVSIPAVVPQLLPDEPQEVLVPAILTFSFEDARNHLINADLRFEDLFRKMPCRPYQQLEQVHPFRDLATSILGQQISWKAARSIKHRFVRLYYPHLPEKPTEDEMKAVDLFPTPRQVAQTNLDMLKSAGLSTRKAEYLQDLAQRFADGRLSTDKLLQADDEALAEMLIEVRGIGRWTGDLGVQRGVARWFLAMHSSSPDHQFGLSPHRLPAGQEIDSNTTKKTTKAPRRGKKAKAENSEDEGEGDDELPVIGASSKAEDAASMPPAADTDDDSAGPIPPAFTPSIKKTLNMVAAVDRSVPSLPEGLTVSTLKSRIDGKKVKGSILTPKEMEALTESWKPYRSLGK
ncbi:hypothetical protein AX16_002084 [Volvariella volvacea WC 439]|nr:hypothetical protein AX16_002084 [Volvariella volvacea WC 439]